MALLSADPTNNEKRDKLNEIWNQVSQQNRPWKLSEKLSLFNNSLIYSIKKSLGFRVQAQCLGGPDIECGTIQWSCSCSDPSIKTCDFDGLSCGSGTCSCENKCYAGTVRTICSDITTKYACETGAGVCSYCVYDNRCYWYSATGPTPTPIPGGGGGETDDSNFWVTVWYDQDHNGAKTSIDYLVHRQGIDTE